MNTFEKMVGLLDAAWVSRQDIVPCLIGPPGIGKTAAVEEHARNVGAGKVVKIIASRCVPSEIVGMTMPDEGRHVMEIYDSRQIASLDDGDILFLDELLEADQMVLSALLTLIESRETASGGKLPDVQIVAATNDTIPQEQLRDNIKQRFMFAEYSIDGDSVAEYIRQAYDVTLSSQLLNKLVGSSGGTYNFLTPRSLTKLVAWMKATPSPDRSKLAATMNGMWNSQIGTEIYKCVDYRVPERQVKDAVASMVDEDVAQKIEDASMEEMMDVLMALPEWDQLKARLSELRIEEPEEDVPLY